MSSKSIVQDGEKQCFLCGRQTNLERHHIMAGPNRKHSEKYGVWVWLCHDCHTGSDGAQYNTTKGNLLKIEGQIAFERIHSHEEWMRIFGRNYL